MKSLLVMLSLAVFVYSCSDGNEKGNIQSTLELGFTVPKDTGTLYYPLDTIPFVSDSNKRSDLFIQSIYSEILFNLKEPILYSYKGKNEIVRFLWMRPFDNPVVIRINKIQDSVYMNIKELGKEFYNSDSFLYKKRLDTTLMVASAEWHTITNNIASDNFFSLSSYDPRNHDNYKDVTMWILECHLGGKYHCINRLYLDTLSLKTYTIAKKIFDTGNRIIPMKNHKEQ